MPKRIGAQRPLQVPDFDGLNWLRARLSHSSVKPLTHEAVDCGLVWAP